MRRRLAAGRCLGAVLVAAVVISIDAAHAQFGPVCGDGVVNQDTERCDEGPANGTPGSCCTAICQFRAPGEVCRAAVDPVCDVAETCTGTTGPCPADQVASTATACSVGDPCTAQDHCDGGMCVPGIDVCSGTIAQAESRNAMGVTVHRRRIDFTCSVDRTDLTGAAKGGSCSAVAFFMRSSLAPLGAGTALGCETVKPGEPSCVSEHSSDLRATRRQRKKLGRDGTALLHMNLNPLARRVLRQQGTLATDLCGTIRLLGGSEVMLKCSLVLAR
ncbi:MAG TPA: hypothetical protein VKU61_07520 [Candidatus Binatia bacterium]|nr:hypothetical protein [Candidatus Binatia bacterium]